MKIVAIIAGVLNLVIMAFHGAMFFALAKMQNVAEATLTTLYLFNITIILMTAFFGFALLACRKELMSTGLGAGMLLFASLFYLFRAAKDFVWQTNDLTTALVCVAIAVLHIVLLAGVKRMPRP